jgi:phosphoribosylformylglycinamidine synthase
MGYYSVVESLNKIVASGGKYQNCYLSLQEYFEKLGDNATS